MTVMSPEEFESRFGGEFAAETVDATPYGPNSHQPVKTGLTPRGKAVLGFAGAAIAATCLVGWQINSASQAESHAKAQEIALKQDQLELEKLKELNKASATNAKTQAVLDTARQKKVDACVTANKGLVGKQLGATYRSVLDDCQAQYGATNTGDVVAAGSVTNTAGTSSGGGSISSGVLMGGAALGLAAAVGLRKGRRHHA
jgi:hypothetical protein